MQKINEQEYKAGYDYACNEWDSTYGCPNQDEIRARCWDERSEAWQAGFTAARESLLEGRW